MGARPLARLINERVKLPLAQYMMENMEATELDISYDKVKDSVNILPSKVIAVNEQPA
jgi:ATP-dependent Clp protease ATP-binding subunit ClpA